MQILLGVEIVGLGLFFKKEKVLAVSDFHIGYEEYMNKMGVLVPRFGFKELIQELEKMLKITGKLDKIIINGDLKHEFGTISDQEWRETLKVLDLLARHCNEVILIKGNHDTILGPIVSKRSVKVVDHFAFGDNYFIHGDKIPQDKDFDNARNVFIGHEHPSVALRDGARVETFKCFLKGKWNKKNLFVFPSMNMVTEGNDILREGPLTPFLKGQNLKKFRAFLIGDEVYDFGELKNIA